MFEKLQKREKIEMHQDSLEPAAIQFTLKHLQESARQSVCFLSAFFMYLHKNQYWVQVCINQGMM